MIRESIQTDSTLRVHCRGSINSLLPSEARSGRAALPLFFFFDKQEEKYLSWTDITTRINNTQLHFWSPSTCSNKLDLGLVDIEQLRNFLDKLGFKFGRIFLVITERYIKVNPTCSFFVGGGVGECLSFLGSVQVCIIYVYV